MNKSKRKNLSIEDLQEITSSAIFRREALLHEKGTRLADRICQKILNNKFAVWDENTIMVRLFGYPGDDVCAAAETVMFERGYYDLQWDSDLLLWWDFTIRLKANLK